MDRKIPHHAITPLIGDDTRLLFLEEGDLIYDEGENYARAFGVPSSRSGMRDFETWAGAAFHLADPQNRVFSAEIFPKRFLDDYKREEIDHGQVLVSVRPL